MRIVIDGVPTLTSSMGGIGYYVYYLLKHMKMLAPEHQYDILYNKSRRKPSNIEGFKEIYVRYPYAKIFRAIGPRLFYHLPLECHIGAFDIWHGTDSTVLPVSKAKKVVTIHDLEFVKSQVTMSSKDIDRKLRTIPYSIKKADRIIAVSQSTKDHIIEIYNIDPKKIDVTHLAAHEIYHPIDLTENEILKIRGKYNLPEDFILYVGGVYPRKNLARMLQAYARAKKREGFLHKFVIVGGNGDNLADVKDCIRSLHLEDEIVYPGYVAIEDMPYIYNLATVFMHVSLFEGFGLPPLEALQCGTPTMVSNLTSLPEVVGDGALIVDAYDVDNMAKQLIHLVCDDELRASYSKKGIQQALKFSWTNTAEKTLQTYEKVMFEE